MRPCWKKLAAVWVWMSRIAREDDLKLRRALSMAPSIDFYKYEVDFRLKK